MFFPFCRCRLCSRRSPCDEPASTAVSPTEIKVDATTQAVPEVRLDGGSDDDDSLPVGAAVRSIPGVTVDVSASCVNNVASPRHSSVLIVYPTETSTFSYAEAYTADYLASLPPLFLAAAGRYPDAIELLLEHGAFPNERDRQHGCTPLHLTVSESFNSWPCTLSLLRHGARVHVSDARGITPCDLCPQLAHEQIRLLLDTLRRTAASVSPRSTRSRPRLDIFRGKRLRRRRVASDPSQRAQRNYSFVSSTQPFCHSDIVASDRISSAGSSGISTYYGAFGSVGQPYNMEADARNCDSERVSFNCSRYVESCSRLCQTMCICVESSCMC